MSLKLAFVRLTSTPHFYAERATGDWDFSGQACI